MNWYFYKIFLPLLLLWSAALIGIYVGQIEITWTQVFICWFLIGPVGTGLGYHRLFSHRQFETWRPVELVIAFLGTLAAYAPVLFWVSNHQFHHKKSDAEVDSSSPHWYGFWDSFLWSRLRERTLQNIDIKNYCTRRLLLDPKLRGLSRHFTKIVWGAIFILGIVSLDVLVSCYLVPIFIEHLRVNLISSASHMKVPFSYRNHPTEDLSYNNFVLGYLTMGFGWHNNHHNNERKLNLREKWWEVDVEGLLGKILSKRKSA